MVGFPFSSVMVLPTAARIMVMRCAIGRGVARSTMESNIARRARCMVITGLTRSGGPLGRLIRGSGAMTIAASPRCAVILMGDVAATRCRRRCMRQLSRRGLDIMNVLLEGVRNLSGVLLALTCEPTCITHLTGGRMRRSLVLDRR